MVLTENGRPNIHLRLRNIHASVSNKAIKCVDIYHCYSENKHNFRNLSVWNTDIWNGLLKMHQLVLYIENIVIFREYSISVLHVIAGDMHFCYEDHYILDGIIGKYGPSTAMKRFTTKSTLWKLNLFIVSNKTMCCSSSRYIALKHKQQFRIFITRFTHFDRSNWIFIHFQASTCKHHPHPQRTILIYLSNQCIWMALVL